MTGQSRTHSWIETVTSTVIGYFVALASQLAVFSLFGIHVPLSSNIGIGLWFTGVSLVRSYVMRRAFNAWHVRWASAPDLGMIADARQMGLFG